MTPRSAASPRRGAAPPRGSASPRKRADNAKSWLGRAKHVVVHAPQRWTCAVGKAVPFEVDLSAARPVGTDGPDSALATTVFDRDPKNGNEHTLVIWRDVRSVAPTADTMTIQLGPLTVAGELRLAVTLDDVPVRDSPFPLHVLPAPPHPGCCELCGGVTGAKVVATAGEPAVFFILLRDACGNRCVGGLKAHSESIQYTVKLRPLSGLAERADGGHGASDAHLALRSGEPMLPSEDPSGGIHTTQAKQAAPSHLLTSSPLTRTHREGSHAHTVPAAFVCTPPLLTVVACVLHRHTHHSCR